MKKTRPAVIVQTVYFNPADRDVAAELGEELYARLTRPLEDHLAHGSGVLVFSAVSPEYVDLQAADTLILVPIIGSEAFNYGAEGVIEALGTWNEELGPGHVLNVLRDGVGRHLEEELGKVQVLTELYGGEESRRKTLDEIMYGVAQLLRVGEEKVRLFISHAKNDLQKTEEAAKKIFDHIVTDIKAAAFFDAIQLQSGHDLGEQLDTALQSGLLVVVRSDSYSSRPWCQKELLAGKKNGLPTLTVDILQDGETRSLAYGGNGPSMVWAKEPATVVSRALVEYVRAAAFAREARRIIEIADLPENTTVLCRPPELLDLAQGPLDNERDRVAVHPDPELPVVERDILRLANPRLRLLTPTTAFRRLFENEALSNPLDGLQVAMSLSVSPDVGGDEGYTEEHFRDAVSYICRCLISAGGAIGYGGDFREDNYTEKLGRLIVAYNETAAEKSKYLHNYLGAPIPSGAISKDVRLVAYHLGVNKKEQALLPEWDKNDGHPPALYYSDMRRFMAEETFARVILGGQAAPETSEAKGYTGRYPGIIEEAWWTLKFKKPLYVVGGFGGAAGVIADLLLEESLPPAMDDATWLADDVFSANAEAIVTDEYFLDERYLGQFEMPKSMADMASTLRQELGELLDDEQRCLDWNGLSPQQNRLLLTSRDPVLIASLVIEGLVKVTRKEAEGKLAIELVRSSITEAQDLAALAVSVLDDIPLVDGAAAALDQSLAGRASLVREEGRALMNLESKDVDARWLYLASLGSPADREDAIRRVEAASRDTAEVTLRHGFPRLGVVAFGGGVLADIESTVKAMLEGLGELAGVTTIVWFEKDKARFEVLEKLLRTERKRVSLTTRLPSVEPAAAMAAEPELFVQVSWRDEELQTVALPPSGTGVARWQKSQLTREALEALSRGGGDYWRSTPKLDELARRGELIGRLLFGDDADDLLESCRGARMTVVHDVVSSRIPFELLVAKSADGSVICPATGAGLNRRLAVQGVPLANLIARPPRSQRLKVLMVINPTGNLPGVEVEATTVLSILEKQPQVEIQTLRRGEATRQNMLEAMAVADVLHYGGHAFFEGPGDHQSGLELADEKLTLSDFRGKGLTISFAFVNSCETGRVRAESGTRASVETEAAAFAEIFLRSGVEAYLGTYWRVDDAAAASFAAQVYSLLAQGESLDAGVRKARAQLLADGERNWGNYLLYGDGRFTLSWA